MRTRRTRKPPLDLTARRYYVYRLLDAAGGVLYIGRSVDPLGRLKVHHKSTTWARDVVEVQAWGPYAWPTACQVERAAIERENPPHNVMFATA